MHGRLFDLALVAPDPLRPAMLAGPPEVDAHQGAAHSACVLFGSYGCHPRFQSRRCSSAGCVLSAARNELEANGGIAREAHGRKMRPRAEGTPEPPPTAPRHRIVRVIAMLQPLRACPSASAVACASDKPPVASLDSSGAIGGVLELPGDDYFIYGGGEVQVKCCVPVHHSTQGIVGSSWIYRLSAQQRPCVFAALDALACVS